MIVVPIFNVSGLCLMDDDVLFCQTLIFTGPGSKMVIVPKKDSTLGAQRVLKIVASTIDTTLAPGAKITYVLTQSPSPLTGFGPSDSETKPPKAADGFSHIQDPLDIRCFIRPSDILKPEDLLNRIKPECKWGDKSYNISLDPASNYPNPNILNLDPPGDYPRAAKGGDGLPGGTGVDGTKGQDGPILEIWVEKITGSGLEIDLRGQPGGDGGDGGNGQHGGNGQKGSPQVLGTEWEDTWIGVPEPTIVCKQEPGRGGDGGKGGDAGAGGRGGNGGDGGTVKVFYTQSATSGLASLNVHVDGGGKDPSNRGNPGKLGTPGEGGKAGPPGDNQVVPLTNVSPCLPANNASDGRRGGIPPLKEKIFGSPGLDGSYEKYPVSGIPKVKTWPL